MKTLFNAYKQLLAGDGLLALFMEAEPIKRKEAKVEVINDHFDPEILYLILHEKYAVRLTDRTLGHIMNVKKIILCYSPVNAVDGILVDTINFDDIALGQLKAYVELVMTKGKQEKLEMEAAKKAGLEKQEEPVVEAAQEKAAPQEAAAATAVSTALVTDRRKPQVHAN